MGIEPENLTKAVDGRLDISLSEQLGSRKKLNLDTFVAKELIVRTQHLGPLELVGACQQLATLNHQDAEILVGDRVAGFRFHDAGEGRFGGFGPAFAGKTDAFFKCCQRVGSGRKRRGNL